MAASVEIKDQLEDVMEEVDALRHRLFDLELDTGDARRGLLEASCELDRLIADQLRAL